MDGIGKTDLNQSSISRVANGRVIGPGWLPVAGSQRTVFGRVAQRSGTLTAQKLRKLPSSPMRC